MFDLDHVFITTTDPAAAERALAAIGLNPTVRREHPGQGTANFCVEFDNAYLEILFRAPSADADAELRSTAVRPLNLLERINWRDTGASPFGIALRRSPPVPGGSLSSSNLTVDTWPYYGPYLPPGASIPIITQPDTPHEPLLFIIQRNRPYAPPTRLPRSIEITSVAISPDRPLSPSLQTLAQLGAVNFRPAERLTLDLACEGATTIHDLRPTLPLLLRL